MLGEAGLTLAFVLTLKPSALTNGAHRFAIRNGTWYNLIGLELKIDKSERIVVPKRLRGRLGFSSDSALEAVEVPEDVLLKRAQERP